jgi:adenylate cyclase
LFEQALKIDLNEPDALAGEALTHFYEYIRQAMRLSPRDPLIGLWHGYLGDAELGLGNFDAAIDEYRNAIESGYRVLFVYSYMAAAYALAGKMDEAKSALAEARRLNPNLTIKGREARNVSFPLILDGLRKAGLPEE